MTHKSLPCHCFRSSVHLGNSSTSGDMPWHAHLYRIIIMVTVCLMIPVLLSDDRQQVVVVLLFQFDLASKILFLVLFKIILSKDLAT